MEVFSYSRLSKYETCPAAFYRHYCMETTEPPTVPLVLGKAVHSVIETAMRLHRKDRDFFWIMSEAVLNTAPLAVDPEEVCNLAHQEIVLQEFHPENKVENHFLCSLADDEEDPFAPPQLQGFIDLWRDKGSYIQLIDWKTNHQTYYPTDTHQLGLYAWHLNRALGKPVRGKLVFLRTGLSLEHEFTRWEMEFSREWAVRLATKIEKKLQAVREGADRWELFPAKVSKACQSCGYAVECIDGRMPDIFGGIKTYSEAQAVGAEIFRLEAALDGMKKLLKQYVEQYGPVVVDDRQFAICPSVTWKWDAKSLEAAYNKIVSKNLNPYDFLTINSTQLKKLRWTDEEIKKLGANKKVTYSFKDIKAN